MTSPLERAARAIWDLNILLTQEECERAARAVLEAIREPSEAMKKAGAFCEPFMTESGAKPMTPGQIIACACYDAMIDAALAE